MKRRTALKLMEQHETGTDWAYYYRETAAIVLKRHSSTGGAE